MLRFDPFRELEELQERLARAFAPQGQGPRVYAPPVDVMEDAEGLHLLVYLPGVDPEKVEVVAEEGVLSVKAERPLEKQEGVAYHRLEGPYGTFARSFNVPSTYDLSRVQARFRHGVLHLLVPKAEATRPKKIQVQVE
ncbi:heat-shock protein Hsp20 [Thermus scotoductus]|uniref:Heat-shock protein Hsp20 n=2 Tax=Thermus scotoductus TaxID=37636 RepID=A0A430S5H8_THESC|nr:Hsp20/alpha crystallin family protein [Thermus scotoductus]RTG92225.1 heat-shock protein Hsp20 [Thermus scotoductus]RTH06158.1 heat-shock protein Hsp20 [Thermus scotoductus]RTH08221.1 heat-shock protein Hsp20 [Thermus scotoductus]RTH09210.1 heat-shock protein Hsp20 [Thermus scotoductus]RTH15245.1 heat-shock protein Hsp20 [Thermus scotoductus]